MDLSKTLWLCTLCVVASPAFAQPANDGCATAAPVGEGTFLFDNSGSAIDGPNDCLPSLSNDVWFAYTASATGTAEVDTCAGGSIPDTTIIAYDAALGCPVPGSPCLAANDDTCGLMSFVSFSVVAGDTTFLQIGGFLGAVGAGTFDIVVVPPIPNDLCAGATPIGEGLFPFDNSGASTDGPIDCDAEMSGELWYVYTASVSGDVKFDTCTTAGSLGDTVLTVYDGALGCPVPGSPCLASDDDGCGPFGFHSEVILPVAAGDSYLLQVGGSLVSTGTGTLRVGPIVSPPTGITCTADQTAPSVTANWTPGVGGPAIVAQTVTVNGFLVATLGPGETTHTEPLLPGFIGVVPVCVESVDGSGVPSSQACCTAAVGAPTNDDCSDATAVGEGVFPFDNVIATLDGPNDCLFGLVSGDVWFLYTASGSGNAIVDTCVTGTIPDTTLTAYDAALGCPTPGSPSIACNDDACVPLMSRIDFPVAAGASYLIQVGGFQGSTGVGNLTITSIPTLLNDTCAAATPIGEGVLPFHDIGALLDGPVDCLPDMSGDVWFVYTASASGDVRIDTCSTTGSLANTTLVVYDGALGCPVPGSPCLAASDDAGCGPVGFHSSVAIPVVGGNSYLVQIGGWLGTSGNATLSVGFVVSPPTGISCTADPLAPSVTASWTPGAGGPPIVAQNIFVNGSSVGTFGPAVDTYTELLPAGSTGLVTICVESLDALGFASTQACCSALVGGGCPSPGPSEFVRGDSNTDGQFDIADPVNALGFLFPPPGGGPVILCLDALDGNDDGQVNIADPIALLGVLFPSVSPPPAVPPPHPACGCDPTPDSIDCAGFAPICP